MRLFGKNISAPVKDAACEYTHHDGGVVELDSSNTTHRADVVEVAVCSFAVLLMLCASAMAFGNFMPDVAVAAYVLTSAIVIAVHQAIGPRALLKGRTRAQLIASIVIVGLAVAISVIALPLVWGGFASMANNVIDRTNDIYALYIAHLPGANASDAASIAFMVVMALLFSLASSIFMQMGSKVLLPVVLIGFMTLGRGFSVTQGITVPAIASAGLLLHAAIQTRFRITPRTLGVGVLIPLLMAAGLWAACSTYHPAKSVANARESIGASIRDFRYGNDTLPLGRIIDSENMNDGEDERLIVTSDKSPANDVLLRGFVGSEWTGSRWVQIDDQSYYGSWQGMMEWFAQNGFNPQTQVANYDELSWVAGTAPSKLKLNINSVGAYRLFVYSPYTLASTDANYELNHDAQMNSTAFFGAQKYSETVVDENPERLLTADVEDLTNNDDAGTFAESEMVYRAFVYDNYCDISEEDAELAKRLLLGYDWDELQDTSLYSMVSRVRLMLQLQAYYDKSFTYLSGASAGASESASASASTGASAGASASASTGASAGASASASTGASVAGFNDSASPEGDSNVADSAKTEQVAFLKAFLETDHRGNSPCFATAAVLAFRSQGVPARYVEGYRLPASRFAEDGSEYLATAYNSEAHAWVEVYRDGVGWIPVEVTPGFYTEIREPTSVVEVERNVEGSPQEDPSNGLVTGATAAEQSDDSNDNDALSPFSIFLMCVGAVVLLLAALVLGLELQRKVRLDTLRDQCESSDQFVQVRALFDDMSYSFAAVGIAFDKGRPEDFVNEVDKAFPKVLREEYVRMLELLRKSVFGGKLLKPHEINTLVRLAKRLNDDLPEMHGREKLMSRYRYLR